MKKLASNLSGLFLRPTDTLRTFWDEHGSRPKLMLATASNEWARPRKQQKNKCFQQARGRLSFGVLRAHDPYIQLSVSTPSARAFVTYACVPVADVSKPAGPGILPRLAVASHCAQCSKKSGHRVSDIGSRSRVDLDRVQCLHPW